jgi:glycosyltransferase involved in cell wall biosynthesis
MSKVCVIIPCYNEEKRLNIETFSNFISKNRGYFSVLFVNDGSADLTLRVLKKIEDNNKDNCFVLNLDKNVGKAEAVRTGINKAYEMNSFSHVAYFDADLATPLSELFLLKTIMDKNPQLLMILCSRIKRLGAKVKRNIKRHILGRVFSTSASIILKLPVYDTQCGAKLIRIDIIPYVFKEPFITSWLFDIEIIARIRNSNPLDIENILFEHPVTKWEDIGGSKLKLKDIVKVPLELLRIHKKYN